MISTLEQKQNRRSIRGFYFCEKTEISKKMGFAKPYIRKLNCF